MTNKLSTVSRPASQVQAPVPTVQDLERQFFAEGWWPGTPADLPEETLAIDRRVCRHLRCPACRRRGMEFQAWHREADGDRSTYRGMALCSNPSCHHAEEV